MRKQNSLGNRLMALALSVMMIISMFPVGAVQAAEQSPYGTVTTFTGGKITGNGTAKVEVLVEETTLHWVEANELRAEGWWVGIDVTAPEGYADNASYKVKSGPNEDFGEAKSFQAYKDGEKDIQLWFPVSAESIRKFAAEGRNLVMTYAFDWDGDSDYEQTVEFAVKPSTKIVLKKGGEQVFPLVGTVTTFTGGTVTGNGTNDMKVLVEETTLQWVAGNDLRAEGWWVGVDVVAPEGYADNASYKVKSGPNEDFGEAKSFHTYKDGEKDIQLWFPVSAESLQRFAAEGRNLTMTYAFDWDGDGLYGQTLVFAVKPGKVILQKEGQTVYPLGMVTTFTGGTVTGNGTANVEVLVEKTTLQWVEANELRAEGWWVGIDVIAPEGYSADASYRVKSGPNEDFGEAKSFNAYKDGEKDIQLWFPVSPESLKKFTAENRNLTMTYAFDWDGNQDYEQVVEFSVKPGTEIVLMQGDVQKYPLVGTVSTFTGGAVLGNGSANVQVLVEKTTLNWVAANDLRAEGWWVGIDVTAPSGYDAAASYKVKSGPNEDFGEAKSFDAYKDGERDIQLWFPVSPESLKKFASEGRNLTMTYAFDWDGDGVYEQTVEFSVKPSVNIVLKQDGKTVYPLGTVDTITGGVVTGNGTDHVEVLVEEAVLQWQDYTAFHPDGWGVGINVTAPDGYDEKACYKVKGIKDAVFDDPRFFIENKSGEKNIELWLWFYLEDLKEAASQGRDLTMTYAFDWNGDGEYGQTVVFSLKPSAKILLMKDQTQVYPLVGTVNTYTGGTVTGNGTNNVEVLVEETTLQWVEGNDLRAEGWWVGIDVIAPEGYDAAASYKVKTGPNEDFGAAKSFDAYKDGEKDIQLWFPVSPESLKKFASQGRNLTMTYAFDWDGDGIYAQTVEFSVKPGRGIVLKKGAVQYYPELGNVSTYTGGTVTGNLTGAVTVEVTEVTLDWSPADETLGREQSWWVGIKAEAPAGLDAAALQNARYQKKEGIETGWEEITDIKSFWNNKDSADQAETQYIQLWMPITPADLQENKNRTRVYRFDWDGNGDYEQEITFTVVPSDKIVLNKVSQTDFAFEVPNPVDHWVGETFTNEAKGNQSTGKVTYAITDGEQYATVDETTGELTFLEPGAVEVTATKAADDFYTEAKAVYIIKGIKKDQTGFKFENSNQEITVGFAQGSFSNKAVGGESQGEVTYAIVSGKEYATIDETTGQLTFLAAGTVKVKATKAEDGKYHPASVTYTLVIEKSEQKDLYFDAELTEKITYSPEAQTVLPAVQGGSGSGNVTYAIVEGNEYATIDENTGVITTLKADGYIVVQITKAGDSGWLKKPWTLEKIYVDFADQTGFGFAIPSPEAITFNDNGNIFENAASGGESIGEITYAITGGAEVATIDASTGKLTILQAGTVEITATKAGDEKYHPVTATYSLTVEKDAPDFSVPNVDLVYGEPEYQIQPTTLHGNEGGYAYEIKGENTIGAQVDKNTGLVTFSDSEGKVGTVTILVTKLADDQYHVLTREFTLTVGYHKTDAKLDITGATTLDNGWFTGAVTVTAGDYQLSYENQRSTQDWNSNISLTQDGIYSQPIYLKKGNEITDAIPYDTIRIDQTDPKAAISYSEEFWQVALNKITFGIYESKTVEVTFTVSDQLSGIASLTYDIGEGAVTVAREELTEQNDGSLVYQITLPANYRNKVKLTAADVAGNTSGDETEHTLVVDNTIPGLKTQWTFDGQREYEDVTYTQKDATVKFTITEANFDLSLAGENAPQFTVNGEAKALSWTQVEGTDQWEASYTLSGDGDYAVQLTYTDGSGNEMQTYTKKVHIDDADPTIAVTYNNNVSRNETYYKADRAASVVITEHSFNPAEVTLTVIAQDITGKFLELPEKDYTAYAKNPNNWKELEADVWSLNTQGMVFDQDASYILTISYADLAGNAAKTCNDTFVLDKTIAEPEEVTITYTESLMDKVLEGVSFGFYQAEVQVTLSVKDQTAGIEYFKVTYNQQDGKNASNKATYTETLAAVQDPTDKTLFTATFTVKPDARGNITVELLDKAGNGTDGRNDTVLVVDDKDPTREVIFTPYKVLDAATMLEVSSYAEGDNAILYYKDNAEITFKITEANFDLSLLAGSTPVIQVNGQPVQVQWNSEGNDVWVATYTITEDGDYTVTMEYTDLSTNKMQTYTSAPIVIDREAPVVDVVYKDGKPHQTIDGRKYYGTTQTLEITVEDHNFRADDVILTVTAKDITGKTVEIPDYKAYAQIRENWTEIAEDTWKLKTEGMVFATDAIYTFDIAYDDILDIDAADYAADDFVIDHADPTDLKIEYSEPVYSTFLRNITFGFYQPKVTVILTAEDITAGVDYFTWKYTQEPGTSEINWAELGETIYSQDITYSADRKTATAEFDIPAQARGFIYATVTDRANNGTDATHERNTTVVVDNEDPTREVFYTPYKVLDAATMLEVSSYAEGDNAILYYKDNAVITFQITEANFDLSLEDGKAPVIQVNGQPVQVQWTRDGDIWTATYTITEDGDYTVTMEYTDLSTNKMQTYTSAPIVIDREAPVVDVVYKDGKPHQIIEGRKYYGTTQTLEITVEEHNFRADDVLLTVTAKDITGKTVKIPDYKAYAQIRENWTEIAEDTWQLNTAGMVLDTDAIYTFDIVYDDILDQDAQYLVSGEKVSDYPMDDFVIDHADPTDLKIEYSTPVVQKIIENITFGFYQAPVTVTLTADDITAGVDFFTWSYTQEPGTSEINWAELGETISTEEITYSADRKTASFSFQIEAQARGYISATVTDRANNSDDVTHKDTAVVVVDQKDPVVTVTYTANDPATKVQYVDANLVQKGTFAEGTTAYFNGDVTATIHINEANFFEGITAQVKENDDWVEKVLNRVHIKVTETRNDETVKTYEYLPAGAQQIYAGAERKTISWTPGTDEHTITIPYANDADYVLQIEYVDASGNQAEFTANDGLTTQKVYTSKQVTVDHIDPVVSVKYMDGKPHQTIGNRNYYGTTQTLEITVEEHNFRADDVLLTVTALDITGNTVEIPKYAAYAQNRENWTEKEQNVWVLNTEGMVLDTDAIYTFDVQYKDLALRDAKYLVNEKVSDYPMDDFVIDHADPTDLKIEYSTPVVQKIIEKVTFGFYQAPVTVTLTADDITAGVDYFLWTYTQQEDTSSINLPTMTEPAKLIPTEAQYSNGGKTATVSFQIEPQARGYISATAFDRSNNSTSAINEEIMIVDSKNPAVTVTYTANDPATKVQYVDANLVQKDTFAEGTTAYFNGDVTATIHINEANFFEGITAQVKENDDWVEKVLNRVHIKLTETFNDGSSKVYEFLPAGAEQIYAGAERKTISWTPGTDEHTITIPYANDADYVLQIEYVDASGNQADFTANDGLTTKEVYTSKQVTVDHIDPIVKVDYTRNGYVQTVNGREYYNAERSATITVTEHNFRADDFLATVTAQTVQGDAVSVEDFAKTLTTRSNWTSDGDVHTITINYPVDANYTFNCKYEDLAKNAAKYQYDQELKDQYIEDQFTVDTQEPAGVSKEMEVQEEEGTKLLNLKIEYSDPIKVWDEIVNDLFFGSYQEKLEVTLIAEDITAGVDYFTWIYTQEEGTSATNLPTMTEPVKLIPTELQYSNDGLTAKVKFDIPAQARGHISAVVYDRSGYSASTEDDNAIKVVDKISPKAEISYNKPVRKEDNISYYDGDIDVKIVITETNFYSEDVVVKVTRKDQNNKEVDVKVKWVDDSTDVHTGTFTLTQDGDYEVSVTYTDRSSNEMDAYKSNQLTLDTVAPTVELSNIKHNSANKDETYGFTITANDINLDEATFKPVLMATVRNEDGSYTTKEIDLGQRKTVETGKTYSYTVENLTEDAVYSFTCTVADMSANGCDQITLEDGQNYEQVRFSVNRDGSTFAVSQSTDQLVSNYYVYSVNEDVVIEEVNVDPIENYKIKLNGQELEKGADYTSQQTSNEGEWSKRTYTISKDLFKAEGEYVIVVESVDKTETAAYSDVKNLNVSFVVDQTPPVLTVSGLENNGRYQVEAQTVTIIPTDDGGRLKSMKVLVLDSEGQPLRNEQGEDISVRLNLSGDAFLEHLAANDGKVTFTVPEGLENQVQIICDDYAVDSNGNTNTYDTTYQKVTVSQSLLIIFYAYKPLFYGTIAGVLLLAGGIIFLIMLKKRKKAAGK